MENHPTRRQALRTGMMALGATAAIATRATTAHAQDQKIAQELVQYQATPKDGLKCNACSQWVEPNACKIVAGKIAPTGYCVAYAPKEG